MAIGKPSSAKALWPECPECKVSGQPRSGSKNQQASGANHRRPFFELLHYHGINCGGRQRFRASELGIRAGLQGNDGI